MIIGVAKIEFTVEFDPQTKETKIILDKGNGEKHLMSNLVVRDQAEATSLFAGLVRGVVEVLSNKPI